MCSATSQRKIRTRPSPQSLSVQRVTFAMCLPCRHLLGKGDSTALGALPGTPLHLCLPMARGDTKWIQRSVLLLFLSREKCWLTRAPVDTEEYCWPWYNELENFCVLMKKRKGKKTRNFTGSCWTSRTVTSSEPERC